MISGIYFYVQKPPESDASFLLKMTDGRSYQLIHSKEHIHMDLQEENTKTITKGVYFTFAAQLKHLSLINVTKKQSPLICSMNSTYPYKIRPEVPLHIAGLTDTVDGPWCYSIKIEVNAEGLCTAHFVPSYLG